MSSQGAKRARGGAIDRGVLLYFELTPSATRRDGDDVIVNIGIARVWTVKRGLHDINNTKIGEFSTDSQIQNQLSSACQ